MEKNREPEKGKQAIVLIALVTALCLLGDSMLYVTLPVYWQEAGLTSLWQVGLLLSVNRFVRLPLNPLIGWLYSRIPLKAGILSAVLLAALTTCGYGLAKEFWLWVTLRCVWGLAWSLLRLGAFFTIAEVSHDHNRGYLMGTYNGLYRLGSLFGMLFGGLLAGLIGFEAVSYLFGLLSFSGIPILLPVLRKAAYVPEAGLQQPAPLTKIKREGLQVILSGLLIAFLFQGVIASTLSYVVAHHVPDGILLFGMAVTASALAGTIQAARWAWEPFLAKRFGRWSDGPKGRLPLFIHSLLVAGIGFLLVPFKLPFLIWLTCILVVMVSATALTTLADALTADCARRTSVLSLMTLYSVAQDLGAALGPFISYQFLRFEHGIVYVFWGGSAILFTIAAYWAASQRKRIAAEPSVSAERRIP